MESDAFFEPSSDITVTESSKMLKEEQEPVGVEKKVPLTEDNKMLNEEQGPVGVEKKVPLTEDNKMLKEEQEPVTMEKSNLVFVLFYALGLLTYVPQSFYITANDYWMYKFRDTNETYNETDTSDKTQMQTDFTSYYSIVSGVTTVVLIFVVIGLVKVISVHKRVIASISIQLIMFIITIIFVWTNSDSWQRGFFILSLVIAALLSGGGTCYLVSVFELSSRFSAVYLGALISGQALCGIVAAIIQILTLAMQTSSKVNAFIYFLIGAVFILGVEVSYMILLSKGTYFPSKPKTDSTEKKKIDPKEVLVVGRKILGILITMILVQGATTVVQPSVTALVESSASGTNKWTELFFVPVCTFLLHHLFDFIGRELATRLKKPDNFYIIITASIIRLGFLPVIMLCNVQPRNHMPVVFGNDFVYAIIMIIFAFTNGYLMNLSVVRLSSACKPEEMSIAVFILLLVLVVTLASFSFFSRLVINMV